MNRISVIISCLLFAFVGVRNSSSTERLELQSKTVTPISSIFATSIENPLDGKTHSKKATGVFISIRNEGRQLSNVFMCNYHVLCLRDSLDNVIAETDTGTILRNAGDTVYPIRVRAILKNPILDLVLLAPVEEVEFAKLGLDPITVRLDLEEAAEPRVGEAIIYCGFPKLVGLDPSAKKNQPLVIFGYVSQAIPDSSSFIVQAPVFSGSSGSPIWSQEDFRFLGVAFRKVTGQESLLYGIRANEIRKWIRGYVKSSVLYDTPNHQSR